MPPARSGRLTSLGLGVVLPALLSLSIACTEQPLEPTFVERLAPEPAPPPGNPAPPSGNPSPSRGPEHIYLANANGLVTAQVALGSAPAWSPDGRRIAFQRGGEVRVIDADGSNEIRLTEGSHPAWSPDGTRIAFTSADGISVMNVDGSAVRTLVRHDFRDDTYKPWDMGVDHPAWSPDGARIAFLHLGDGDVMPAQAFVMSSDGSNRYLLTRFPDRKYAESDPSWSPDGSKIVYWSYGYGIALISSDGGLPTTIYSDFPAVAYGAKPVWSPDGSSVAFNKWRHWATGTAIWIMSATGSGAKALIPGGYDAAWSPDGARLAFVSVAYPAGIYDRVSPSSIPGTQRYVFYDDSTFSLQYVRPDWGFFEYTGRYSQAGSLLTFDFDGWSSLGPLVAGGILRGDTLTLKYNIIMVWNDFEDGVFVRASIGSP